MDNNTNTEKNWILIGIIWGIIMFVVMELVEVQLSGEEIAISKLPIALIIWLLAGLAFGLTMKGVNKS